MPTISLETPAADGHAGVGDRFIPLRHAAEIACRQLDRDATGSLDYATSILLSARALSMVTSIWIRHRGVPRALTTAEVNERLFRCGRTGRLPGMKGLDVLERDLDRAIGLLNAARTTLGAGGIEFLDKPLTDAEPSSAPDDERPAA